jgi:NitT/TauT family transport system permease protein
MTASAQAGSPRVATWARLGDHRVFWQRLLVWGGLLVVWQVVGVLKGAFFFPSVTDVVGGFEEVVRNGYLGTFATTLGQLFLGYGFAVAIGVPLGMLTGASRRADGFLKAYVDFLFVTEIAALLPFLIIAFGTGLPFRTVVVVLFAIVYIVYEVAAGTRSHEPRLMETARAFRASRLQAMWYVVLPSMVPFLFAGLRLGFGAALKGMVLAELWVITGTGGILVQLGNERRLAAYFALGLLVSATGVIGAQLIRRLERVVAPWTAFRGYRS